jgi:hypothetical protein
MNAPPKRKAPAGLQTETGAGTSMMGDVQSFSYQETESRSSNERLVSVQQERGFVRLIVTPVPADGIGLPSTYSSMFVATSAAERLCRERGWSLDGETCNV